MHNIVIADDALMDEAADATEIFGGRTPSLFRFSRSATEATIVVGQETAQGLAGGGQIGGAREAEFTGKAILKSAPQALDAALGLRAVGRNVGDAELGKSATELSRLAFPSRPGPEYICQIRAANFSSSRCTPRISRNRSSRII